MFRNALWSSEAFFSLAFQESRGRLIGNGISVFLGSTPTKIKGGNIGRLVPTDPSTIGKTAIGTGTVLKRLPKPGFQ